MDKEFFCSVIIPAYNCAKYIKETVDSVLKQTFQNFEIIIVDDCSKDNTREVLKEIAGLDGRIKVIYNDLNKGVADTRNTGVFNARYDWIAFLDSDDIWKEDKLEKQFKLVQQKDTFFVYTGYDFVNESGEKLNINFEVPKRLHLKSI